MNQLSDMTADEVKRLLGLQPHPCEGGWFVQTYQSDEHVPANAVADKRYPTSRRVATAIYYLLEQGTFSEMHCLKSDEVFHHYAGGSVEMLQLLPDGTSKSIVIGKDLAAGERPQVLVPRRVWQGSRLLDATGWALLGCTVSPGFEFQDYETGFRSALCQKWPDAVDLITALTRH
jgi:uncharacterized protein